MTSSRFSSLPWLIHETRDDFCRALPPIGSSLQQRDDIDPVVFAWCATEIERTAR